METRSFCRVSEIVCFNKNFHTRKLGEIEVIYAASLQQYNEFELKALSLSHLYSVSYYQKTIEKNSEN